MTTREQHSSVKPSSRGRQVRQIYEIRVLAQVDQHSALLHSIHYSYLLRNVSSITAPVWLVDAALCCCRTANESGASFIHIYLSSYCLPSL